MKVIGIETQDWTEGGTHTYIKLKDAPVVTAGKESFSPDYIMVTNGVKIEGLTVEPDHGKILVQVIHSGHHITWLGPRNAWTHWKEGAQDFKDIPEWILSEAMKHGMVYFKK